MRRTMDDAESRLRAKLRELPDGSWTLGGPPGLRPRR